jgi:hypothetical protein
VERSGSGRRRVDRRRGIRDEQVIRLESRVNGTRTPNELFPPVPTLHFHLYSSISSGERLELP